MSDDRTHAIETRRLNLWYGKFQALVDVSVDIRRGIITSLIGPSGCGKTTLLRCFNRVNERYAKVSTTGEVRVLGENIYSPEVSLVELRKAVGMVFQRPNPLPISVYENVVFGLKDPKVISFTFRDDGPVSVPEDIRAEVKAISEKIAAGEIKTDGQ